MSKMTLLQKWETTETFTAYAATDRVNINAAKTTKTLTTIGADQLTVHVQYIDVGAGSATAITIYVDESEDGTNWSPGQTAAVASGVVTLNNRSWTYASPTANDILRINVPITAPFCRVRVTSTGGTLDQDRATVLVRAHHVGG